MDGMALPGDAPATKTADAALTDECQRILESLPKHLRDFAQGLADQVANFAEAHEIPPCDMAAAVCGLAAGLALVHVHGNVADEAELSGFMRYMHRLQQVALAKARIAEGWRPPATH